MHDEQIFSIEDTRSIDEMVRDLRQATGQRREREVNALYERAIVQLGLNEEEAAAFVEGVTTKRSL